ncbi:MAG: protein kinase, partial [Planctomycetes bacterium]|nr:protein kinase [Planctomycetota bacterium]
AQGAAKLSHPNVVAVYDIGETEGTHYIVMELIKGGSAQDILRTRGPFHWTEATSILIDVCRGMAAAHKARLIHRDIKPANILRSTDGIVKLGDFGLVKPTGIKGTAVTALGEVVGTPHYMSPEQSRCAPVDERSDIYSLGATYYALLTGQPPYQAADSMQILFAHCAQPIPDPRNIDRKIPEKCTEIIHRAMAKNRAQRYASAGDMLADLEQVLELQPGNTQGIPKDSQTPPFVWSRGNSGDTTNPLSLANAYPAERTEAAVRWKRKRAKVVGISLLCLLVVAILIARNARNKTTPGTRTDEPVVEKDDWPNQAAAAEKAIRTRDTPAMRSVLESIKVLQKRTQGQEPRQQNVMRQTASHLERVLAFRESITEKGLVLGMDAQISSVVFSPDDQWLAVGQVHGGAGAVVWNSHTGEKRYTLWPNKNNVIVKVQALAFAHDNSILAAACSDGMGIKLWHFANQKETSLDLGPGVIRPLSVVFSPISRTLVAGLEPIGEGKGKPYLKIWNLDTGLEPFKFKVEHSGKIWSVAYCTGGHQVASGSKDKRVVMWNAETGRIWRELRTGLDIRAIACAPQGRTFAVAGEDQERSSLQFWDYAGERLLDTKVSPHGKCLCVAFSRNGTVLASGSGSKIMLWNPDTHELLATLTGHGYDVTSLAFSADGAILATGSLDQTVRLWDVSRFVKTRPEP